MLDATRPTYEEAHADACAALVRHLVQCRVAELALAYRRHGKVDRDLLLDTVCWASELVDAPQDIIHGAILAAVGRRADELKARSKKST